MTDTSRAALFELVRRGYDRDQVDQRINQLAGERDRALSRTAALEQRVQELLAQTEDAQAQVSEGEPAFERLGPRIEQILRLAKEEAEELGYTAREAADHEHEQAVAVADRLRADADAFASGLRTATEQEYKQHIDNAQALAAELRAEAHTHATAVREEAEAFYEDTRIRAVRASADFEAGLAKRRDQAERDLSARQAKAEARLAEIERRGEQLRLEAEQLRTDAERRAGQTEQTAQQQADHILIEAKAKADRIRNELERELVALANRRDSISAQLTNVRAMLATLTGGAVSPAGAVDDEGTSTAH
jgi:hypothetical protein